MKTRRVIVRRFKELVRLYGEPSVKPNFDDDKTFDCKFQSAVTLRVTQAELDEIRKPKTSEGKNVAANDKAAKAPGNKSLEKANQKAN